MLYHALVDTLRHRLSPSRRQACAARPFVPMAVFCDEAQAYKPQAESMRETAQRPVFEGTAAIPAAKPCTAAPGRATSRQRKPLAPALKCSFTPAGMVLQGQIADVCAELERLVAQEDRWLQAG